MKTVPQAEPTPHQSADADSCLAAARVSSSSASGTAGLGSHREPIQYRAPASQPSRGRLSRGRATRLAEQTGFAPNTETFSAVYVVSVSYRSRLARSPGGLGGRSRIEFIVSPLPRRRHNESHFAAEPPERSFFFPLFLSPRKKKRLLAATQSQNPCHQSKTRQSPRIIMFNPSRTEEKQTVKNADFSPIPPYPLTNICPRCYNILCFV